MDHDTGDTNDLVMRGEFSTTDVDVAEDLIRRAYVADSKLSIGGIAQDFTFSHSSLSAAGFSMNWPRFGVSLTDEAVTGPEDPLVVVQPTSSRIAYVETAYPGDAYADTGDMVLFPPAGQFQVISERFDALTVQLDRPTVTAYAAAMTGLNADELAFHALTPQTAALAGYWDRTVAYVRDHVLNDSWAATSPIALDQAFQSLTAALLSTFPNTALARATDPETPPARGAVPAARLYEVLDYLDTHADRPIGPSDITELAGMPVNEIVEGLRRRRGVHPAQLLWAARLRGVRRDLLDADPHTAAPVAWFAARWGFTRVGRFRIAYRRTFDETPEQTLRR